VRPTPFDPKGRDQLDRHVSPREEIAVTDQGHAHLVKAPDEPKTESRATAHRRLSTQKALALYGQGESIIDIAAALGVRPSTITGWMVRHRREIALADIDEQLDRIAVPLATENLIHGLLAGDKDYTLETLKGRGRFRRHVEDKSTLDVDLPPLVIRFEMPDDDAHPSADSFIAGGRIVGAVSLPDGPRTIETKQIAGVHEPQPIELVGVGTPNTSTD